jgi:ABC-2 type transport system ATP-binding protein
MLQPTSGSAAVNGIEIGRDDDGVRKSIGIVFQSPSFDEELSAGENMDLHGRLYRIPSEVRRERIQDLLIMVGLEDRRDDQVKTFSGGMKRRLEIARGLLHHPCVLFLDEPTFGLDPQTRNHIWNYISGLSRTQGTTIVLTTHNMEEADHQCDRVGIIDRGKIIAIDSPHNLKEGLGEDLVTLRSQDPGAIAELLKEPWIVRVETHDDAVIISLRNAELHISTIVSAIHPERNSYLLHIYQQANP